MKWYIEALKKYAIFSGRSRRKEYWHFVFFNFIIGIIISLLSLIPISQLIFWIVGVVYSLGLFIPSVAVTVRRLHDTNRSGFCILLSLIPIVGIIILFIYLIQDGTPEKNDYGLSPKVENTIPSTDNKKYKILVIPLLIILGITLLISFYYFAFQRIGSKEQFGIFNVNNHNYYLHIVSDQNISQFSFRRYIEINGVKYYFILRTGQYRLGRTKNIFQSERNDDFDFYTKMKSIYSVFKIVDENNNIVWDLYGDNSIEVRRTEAPIGTVFWTLSFE